MKSDFLHLRVASGNILVDGLASSAVDHRLENSSGVQQGVYAEWNFDGKLLSVQTSRHGLVPLFAFITDAEVCISWSLLKVVEKTRRTEFDDDAIAVFLRVGYFLENDTPFKDVKVVRQSVFLSWTMRSFSLRQVGEESHTPYSGSREAALQSYIELFSSAMQARLRSGACELPLSGGRDSRHILLELIRMRRKPSACVTCTFPPPRTNSDVALAKLLCDMLEIPHRVLKQSGSFLRRALRKNLMTSLCTDEHTWALPLIDGLGLKSSYTYDGIGGDVLSAGLFATPERLAHCRNGDAAAFARDVLGGAAQEVAWTRCLRKEALERFSYDRALARMTLAVIPHMNKPNPIASYFFWNRTRREIALFTFRMYPAHITVYAPYLDDAVFDFLMALPGELLLDHQFHTDAISQAFPAMSAVPYDLDDVEPNNPGFAYSFKLGAEACAYVLARNDDRWLEKGFVVPRLLLLATRGPRHFWLDLERLIWLTQLQRITTTLSA